MPGAVGTAFDKPDREDIDMPRGDLERIAAVIKQLWMPSIECDVDRRMGGRFLIGHRVGLLEERFTHSCATSLAYVP